MLDQKIHILGEENLVVMLSLLGLEGTIINTEDEFLEEFNILLKKPSISMIVIAFSLSSEIINFLLNFKLNNNDPFIFILPDVFQPHIDKEGKIIDKILEAIGDIVLS